METRKLLESIRNRLGVLKNIDKKHEIKTVELEFKQNKIDDCSDSDDFGNLSPLASNEVSDSSISEVGECSNQFDEPADVEIINISQKMSQTKVSQELHTHKHYSPTNLNLNTVFSQNGDTSSLASGEICNLPALIPSVIAGNTISKEWTINTNSSENVNFIGSSARLSRTTSTLNMPYSKSNVLPKTDMSIVSNESLPLSSTATDTNAESKYILKKIYPEKSLPNQTLVGEKSTLVDTSTIYHKATRELFCLCGEVAVFNVSKKNNENLGRGFHACRSRNCKMG
jgi:hypothetical protein